MHRTVIRAVLAVLLALGAPLALAGTAEAKPDYGHVSGDTQPGYVVARNDNAHGCAGGRLVLRNDTSSDDAKQHSGNLGTFTVCVTQEAFDSHPVGTWFNNMSGTSGVSG